MGVRLVARLVGEHGGDEESVGNELEPREAKSGVEVGLAFHEEVGEHEVQGLDLVILELKDGSLDIEEQVE